MQIKPITTLVPATRVAGYPVMIVVVSAGSGAPSGLPQTQ